ncbi:hypothetical protein SERLADRAFT_368415 [Serpula lacrymans var. lacrymans S7.9]|uniref:BZIP domain-containing protein n=1 Tax=Serpula lacrymans var. lacrymans (strain S7.9) TaxID=578457 RepID=F8NS71_SERL9|nr:uncharacterized protein SERLADRAFT_368415 [Serpula lacrymans var. lacrymans S7.9]EGO26902.1 hypothetical protein SERLADRAFT_368415 [Serpula lacrymans var. lacrymans S7.9]
MLAADDAGGAGAKGVEILSDRPERSRNAKAQARHRAKRKAYIEQLEQTVTKLQTALGFTPDQVATLPPPLVKIRELEQENVRLQKENDELRRLLGEPDHRNHHLSSDYRRPSLPAFHDSRSCDRELKKRKMTDDLYMHTDNLSRPPPLTIPQPLSHHYNNIPSHHNSSNHVTNSSSSLFSLHGPAFQMPNTPSGSSSTSSPPFSASPAQMQPSSHSPLNHRPSSLSHHALSNYSHSNHYGSVKVEDENFGQQSNHHTHNGHGHSGHYQTTLPPFAQTAPEPDLDSWHTYSAERAQVHR